MRIVACSDAHLDWRTAGVERYGEIVESFEHAVEFAMGANPEKKKANVFAFTGDLCDSDDGRDVLRATSYAVSVADRLCQHGIVSIWVAGNHDVCGDDATTTLDPVKALTSKDVIAATSGPVSVVMGTTKAFLRILALPYSPKPYNPSVALTEAALLARERDYPLLVFSHLMLPGMHLGSESAELARGKDRMFPLDVMREVKPKLVISGHYHRAQTTEDGIKIPGSLARLTFDEQDHAPSFLVIDSETDFR